MQVVNRCICHRYVGSVSNTNLCKFHKPLAMFMQSQLVATLVLYSSYWAYSSMQLITCIPKMTGYNIIMQLYATQVNYSTRANSFTVKDLDARIIRNGLLYDAMGHFHTCNW